MKKIAVVHDFLAQYGGAEKVVEALHEIFPEAPVFTSIYLPDRLPEVFRAMDVRTSFMQGFPGLGAHYKKYLPLYPRAIESFDLRGYDVVLSSSSAFAKGARAPAGARHLCYCYTPMRFVWTPESYFEKEKIPAVAEPFLPFILRRLKTWDLSTVDRVDDYIAISGHIRDRIRRCWGRGSEVVYPPVDVEAFRPSAENDGYYLIVSRLNPYKRIDLAVEAFNRMGKHLLVAGDGPDAFRLRSLAGPSVRFLGRVTPEELAILYARCRAFVFPGEEDFGIAPVEAMAVGKPVIAYGAGGALETVVEGETGFFFRKAGAEDLIDVVRLLERTALDPMRARRRAEAFGKDVFQRRIRELVSSH